MKKSLVSLLCFFMFINIVIVSGEENKSLIFELPENINYPVPFEINLTLINFSGTYDVKIDVFNSSDRLSEIYNSGEEKWQSTFNYINQVINSSETDSYLFLLNITKIYSGLGNITLKLRNSSGIFEFNEKINISYINMTQNNSDNENNETKENTVNEKEVYLEIDYDEDDLINQQEFEIEINAFNLEGDYNLKIWVEFENNTIISDRYDEEEEKWKSGRYYLYEFLTGKGNKSKDVLLKIREDYEDYEGGAILKIKIQDIGILAEENIIILENEKEDKITGNIIISNSNKKNNEKESKEKKDEIIYLNSISKDIKSQNNNLKEYKSKTQYIKEYSIYGFALFCVLIIVLLLMRG